jgi:tRNA/tmRNA/rRNA uracil-C5-methylase (TrmA/RlmC/RlmD family)
MTSFSDIFRRAVQSAVFPNVKLTNQNCTTYRGEKCRICTAIDLAYKDEITIKEKAFTEFWKSNRLPGSPEKMISSPIGRGYRTVSKRRVFRDGNGQTLLGLTDISESGRIRPLDVIACAIEPAAHTQIYRHIQQFLASREGATLSSSLSHVVIKGSYDEYWIIFNMEDASREINGSVTRLSKGLTAVVKNISGLFYVVEERSKYYLSDRAHEDFRKIYGKNEVYLKIRDLSMLFSPLAFSQTNASIVETMVDKAMELLKFNPDEILYDLYSGFGLFGLSAAKRVHHVTGIESSPAAVKAAKSNAARNKISNVRFYKEKITSDSLGKLAPKRSASSVVILDPPRNGTAPGVIEFLAEQYPKKILHIFCEADLIPAELKRWTQNGYRVSHVVPLDMFPATEHIETMVLLEPK